jgi:DNA-binding response OmpR family regulator
MVLLVVTADAEPAEAESLVAALRGKPPEIVRTSHKDLPTVLSDHLLTSLAAVVVVSGSEPEAGHRACQEVRECCSTPLCLVCTSCREVDEVMAFANGCDDFIRSPCSPPVLRARLGALIERGRGGTERVMTFGCLRVDPRLRTVSVRGEPVELTRTEFDLVNTLVANRRRVVPRHELLEAAWGDCPTHDHVLDVHMSRLRSKVLAAGGPKLGEAVPGVGYRVGHFTCPPGECRPYGAA